MPSTYFVVLSFLSCLFFITCPPVSEKPTTEKENEEGATAVEDETLGLEYERYMREVVKLLESDEGFRKKLEQVNASQIRSGEIASHLDFVSHNIRTKLDEAKRNEVDRLRSLLKVKGRLKKKELDNSTGEVRGSIPTHEIESIIGHLDSKNPNSFEVEDLVKLIKKTTSDLEELDVQRKEEFKKYEMEKEHLRQEELKKLTEEERLKAEKKHEEMEKKHKDHPKINHPGNEEQLKEVWEEADGLDPDDFDPKTFFHLHDTNGDGLLDITELEALFQKELDKMYDINATEDDMVERFEEMNRMREHVMKEVDTDGDQMVSLEEFLRSTQREEFKKDESWETLDNQTIYTDEELTRFEKEYADRMAHQEGVVQMTTPLPPSNQQENVEQHHQKKEEHDRNAEQQQNVKHHQQHVESHQQPVEQHQQPEGTSYQYKRRPPTVIPLSQSRRESRHNPRDPPPDLF